MRPLPLLAVLALLSCSGCAQESHACGSTTVYTVTENGAKYSLVLDSAIMERTPVWDPSSGDPPLSVAKAAATVGAWAKAHYPGTDSSPIRAISLDQFGCSGGSVGHWYYRFDLTLREQDGTFVPAGNFAAVLMDGSVVGPTPTKVGSNNSSKPTP